MADFDHDETPHDDGEPSFAELLAASERQIRAEPFLGEKIRARVITIGADTIAFDAGTKADAVGQRTEFVDADGNLSLTLGDTLELYVVACDEVEITLSRALSGPGGLDQLHEARRSGVPVTGQVRATCKGGYDVEVFKRRAFCPASQMDLPPGQPADSYLGQNFRFQVMRVEEGGRNIVLARRPLLEQEAQQARERFLESLRPGTLVEGRVARLAPFGAFVTLTPGLDGLIPISEVGWSRVEKLESVLTVGEPVQVKVMEVAPGDKPGRWRIALSLRQTTPDPWQAAHLPFSLGARVSGRVTRLAEFGAFVALAPGLEGLIHVSELSYDRRIRRAQDLLQPGEMVTVVVKEIDVARRRLSLSLREAGGDPWEGAAEKYPLGRQLEAEVERMEAYGLFVRLEPGVVGLLPRAALDAHGAGAKRWRQGDRLHVEIQAIDLESRRITLVQAMARGDTGWEAYSGSSASRGGLGGLGDTLREALERARRKP
jgi:small subunit ribosomal protein S1